MNKNKLKSYAPQARKDFIAAVTARANLLGLSSSNGHLEIIPATHQGDVTLIDGRSWPSKVFAQRENLIKRMKREGFEQTVEAVAYTWFNRFAALRYMELHDYLDHGYRVLSNVTGGEGGNTPAILLHAVDLAQGRSLPGLNAQEVTQLKLAGNQDGELYRRLLVAQCNALSNAMPFLFERIDDETELLLPDNLLRTDSVIAKLVSEIPEEDWQEVEVIGWLYQFYISEKKDAVIGKVVKSEDIPAATQLFTPNWIVQYLVQNSVGRLWSMANPASTLKGEWDYYIEPAEQTPEVNAQLDALIQTRIAEDGGNLNPESITVLDPACGSGHILVVAYDVLRQIYLERGYQARAIPRLILEKNLYGLDIDDRAAQLAGFALLMKARADDRRLLDDAPVLNVLSLQESKVLDLDELSTHLSPFGVQRGTLKALLDTFAHAKTFGSLIQIPEALDGKLVELGNGLRQALERGDLYAKAAAQDLMPLLGQAIVLGIKFDAVVANPPYMGGKGMNPALKEFAKANFPDSKADLFAMFIERGFGWCKLTGFNSMVTMQSWMFLSSYMSMRERLLQDRTIFTMAHLGARAFSEISGEVVQTTAFVLQRQNQCSYSPAFFRLVEGREEDKEAALRSNRYRFDATIQNDFGKIPGSPIAYWVGANVRDAFVRMRPFRELGSPKVGMQTSNNSRYLRYWWEIDFVEFNDPGKSENPKWIIYLKGGPFRRWYGNLDYLLRYNGNANYILVQPNATVLPISRLNDPKCTWTDLTSGAFNCRLAPNRSFHDISGHCFYPKIEDQLFLLGATNAKPFDYLLSLINATFHFQVGDVGKIPVPESNRVEITSNVEVLVALSKRDWDGQETSWEFSYHPWVKSGFYGSSLSATWLSFSGEIGEAVKCMQQLEEQNNRLFIEAYGLQNELSPDVPEAQVTLTRADREKDSQRLISYAIGCMMGRYSLDEPGLMYAHAGNIGFDTSRYKTFPADPDGIVPLTDELWFEDDAANRVREFLLAVWGSETLDENMAWLAESLGQKGNETPDETIRRYLSSSFFKDHLQTYKKRPIYWLFSSGKQGAFQALVYLHRYNESTLARMRAEYVVPLTGKIQSRIEMLEKDAESASTAARNKLGKEIEKLRKKHVELLAYDEKLRHFADMRISLDLDDGVKVNYGKFGDLLAEVKAVTGGAGDD
jgi:type II restriction/modification system DNA methylase subunit YeeA